MKVGRNQPCPCGSGKKLKHCHVDEVNTGRVKINNAKAHNARVASVHAKTERLEAAVAAAASDKE